MPSPWHPRVQTSSPCHHCSDGKVSGCLGDEGRGGGKGSGVPVVQFSVKAAHMHKTYTQSKIHKSMYAHNHRRTTTHTHTHAPTYTHMLSDLRTGGASARGQGYPSSDVLFLHVQRDNKRERECFTTVWLHRFLSYRKTLLLLLLVL